MQHIDLRSDTVTQPTPAMRKAMANAKVGDDVYGEDPTVNQLQALAAKMLGKEAGLFIPSGTMGNLVAILSHCQRGDEIILGHLAHTFLYEAGGMAALGGVIPHTIPNQPDGTLNLEDIRAAIRPDDAHHPITRLVTLENTHNRCGGAALTAEYTQTVSELARQHGLKLHLDGARIFNAATSMGVSAADLVASVDSITFCLSKALCAPVGSVLCGDQEFISRAHRVRKVLGGGMRQVGILAAAGIVALEEIVPRLEDDHRRTQMLARGLAEIPGIVLDKLEPPSNMVYLTLNDNVPLNAPQVAEKLSANDIRVGVVSENRFRLVTHYWIDDEAIDKTIEAFAQILKGYL